MHSSNGMLAWRRSKSTTDIFRTSSLDDASYPPVMTTYSTATMSRTNGRRRRAPSSPQHFVSNNNNNNYDDDNNDEASLKRARSYLTDDIRQQFALGFEYSTAPGQAAQPVVQQSSPRSNSFVKRLVATLERRQRDTAVWPGRKVVYPPVDDELHKKIYNNRGHQGGDDGNIISENREQQLEREQVAVVRINPDYTTVSRVPLRPLEKLQEREERDEDSSDPDDFWDNDEIITPLSTTNSINNDDEPAKPSTRRTLKSMLSSLISWRPGAKSLPKGSRDYYATRESLGEEMRAFRRDTMPQLMEHAAGKNRKRKDKGAGMRNRQRDHFAELISGGKPRPAMDDQAVRPSIATIHPVYGAKAGASQHNRLSRNHESDDKQEVVYGSIKVEPPAVPPRAIKLAESNNLLLPSKMRDLRKRLSQELSTEVQLRRGHQIPTSSSVSCPASIIYDVPRSNRRVVPAPTDEAYARPNDETPRESQHRHRTTPPEYANVQGIINGDDKRLHCTAFTTF